MLYFQTAGEVKIFGIKSYSNSDIFHRSLVSHLEPVLEYCHKNCKKSFVLIGPDLPKQLLTWSLKETFCVHQNFHFCQQQHISMCTESLQLISQARHPSIQIQNLPGQNLQDIIFSGGVQNTFQLKPSSTLETKLL